MGDNLDQLAKRTNHEAHVLAHFIEVARVHQQPYFSKQTQNNRINLGRNVYFQFGDLRIDTPARHILVEVESGGGVTNITKYWYCLEYNLIQKPITLIHLFLINNLNDYASHVTLWRFLDDKMTTAFPDRYTGHAFTYTRGTISQNLQEPLSLFGDLIQAE
jgi:hypothetical protein